jgi:hypothetical protein
VSLHPLISAFAIVIKVLIHLRTTKMTRESKKKWDDDVLVRQIANEIFTKNDLLSWRDLDTNMCKEHKTMNKIFRKRFHSSPTEVAMFMDSNIKPWTMKKCPLGFWKKENTLMEDNIRD